MTDAPDPPQTRAEAPRGRSVAEQRAERLKAALRDNLRRRKAQIRGRSTPDPDPAETPESDREA